VTGVETDFEADCNFFWVEHDLTNTQNEVTLLLWFGKHDPSEACSIFYKDPNDNGDSMEVSYHKGVKGTIRLLCKELGLQVQMEGDENALMLYLFWGRCSRIYSLEDVIGNELDERDFPRWVKWKPYFK
jgi:hypothetical protein